MTAEASSRLESGRGERIRTSDLLNPIQITPRSFDETERNEPLFSGTRRNQCSGEISGTTAAKAWRAFDRSTAYMCRLRGEPFDAERCQAAWDAYVAITGPAPTPIGLKEQK